LFFLVWIRLKKPDSKNMLERRAAEACGMAVIVAISGLKTTA